MATTIDWRWTDPRRRFAYRRLRNPPEDLVQRFLSVQRLEQMIADDEEA